MRSLVCRGWLAWLVFVLFVSIGLPGARQEQDPLDPELRARMREANRNLVAFIRSELANPEARPHDVSARAALLDHDPDAIFAFVRDEIRFEPYPGLQRGPSGVLVSGAGNAADQAWLLRDLLHASGFEARMVDGTLSGEQVTKMLTTAAAALVPEALPFHTRPFGRMAVNEERLRAVCEQMGLAASELLRPITAMEEAQDSEWTSVLALTARETAFLEERIAAAGLAPAVPSLRDELEDATRSHAWVQYKPSPQSAWTNLDPSFPDLGAGEACIEPNRVDVDPLALGDRFQFSLRLERQVGEKQEEVVILEQSLPVPELLTRPLRIEIGPTSSQPPVLDESLTEDDFYQLVTSLEEFQGRVTVGGEKFGSMVFDYDGQVSEVMADGRIQAAGDLGGAITGGLGGAFGGGRQQEEQESTLLTVWADFALLRVDETIWKQRRVILPKGERSTWSPILDWRFLFQTHEISGSYLRFARLSRRLRSDAFLELLMDWEETGDSAVLRRAMGTRSCYYPIDLLELCRARQAFLRPSAAESAAGRMLYFDRSNVFVLGSNARIDEAAKRVVHIRSIDIMENGALVLRGANDLSLDREATRALGVFDTVLERALVRRLSGAESSFGTVEFFERARILGCEPRLVSARDQDALREAGISAADTDWITAHAAPDEYVLVASGEEGMPPGGSAWWALDVATGRTLGRCGGGGGQGTVEDQLLRLSTISNILCAWTFLKPAESMEAHVKGMVWCTNSGRVGKILLGFGPLGAYAALILAVHGVITGVSDIIHTAAGE